ncbi:50S ribosomal protein L24 [Patescibacteria group bacterium]
MKIKLNDKVKIISGKDKGKNGKVIQIMQKENLVVVEGLNLLVKHIKGTKDGKPGQKIQFPCPLNLSKIMLLCPHCEKMVKIGYKRLENKKKVRFCKKCNETL